MADSVWQPVETAPKNTPLVLCGEERRGWAGGLYEGQWHMFMGPDEMKIIISHPTHWMPLPKAPE